MQCIRIICVKGKRNRKDYAHTHGGDKDWLCDSAIAYVYGAKPRCKVFHYTPIRLHVGLM